MTSENGAQFDGVRVELTDDHVGTVLFSRPPNNFFDVELVTEVADAFERLANDITCRVIVLRSAGQHFCAGAQLHGDSEDVITMAPPDENPLYAQALRLVGCAVPTIAVVQGAAIGGGLGVALAADFRIASRKARFAANFAKLGMHQGFGITLTLPAVVGQQRALELLYTGRRVTGDEAFQIGLVDQLVAPDELPTATDNLAQQIAASAPLAVRSIRQTMRAELLQRMVAVTHREHAAQRGLRRTVDFKEGVEAYASRRPAKFVGR
ncbi:hypothetical protein A5653_25865 [Mycobacterium colombiense]|nr:hypothetical protein A5653_25865 [Mycobacterium colombiense]